MLTDKQFSEILEPLGYDYDVNHDNIYTAEGEILAVVDSVAEDNWLEDYTVMAVRIENLDDERTLALRAACVLHEIEIKEWV